MNTEKKYQVIYADPPWDYGKGSFVLVKGKTEGKGGHWEGKRGNWRDKTSEKGKHDEKEKLYPTMSIEEMKCLPIKESTDKDAVLFMWTTDNHLPHALEVIKAWGFSYSTIGFVWEKQTCKGNPVNMLAPWTLKSCELCILATKGSPMKLRKDKTIRQLVKAERIRHSQKPQEVADRIVRMFPDCTRIELFARDAKPGWDVWGNEINNTIEL
jgi:N6-adenosine-specific RNA methylase IME4